MKNQPLSPSLLTRSVIRQVSFSLLQLLESHVQSQLFLYHQRRPFPVTDESNLLDLLQFKLCRADYLPELTNLNEREMNYGKGFFTKTWKGLNPLIKSTNGTEESVLERERERERDDSAKTTNNNTRTVVDTLEGLAADLLLPRQRRRCM